MFLNRESQESLLTSTKITDMVLTTLLLQRNKSILESSKQTRTAACTSPSPPHHLPFSLGAALVKGAESTENFTLFLLPFLHIIMHKYDRRMYRANFFSLQMFFVNTKNRRICKSQFTKKFVNRY